MRPLDFRSKRKNIPSWRHSRGLSREALRRRRQFLLLSVVPLLRMALHREMARCGALTPKGIDFETMARERRHHGGAGFRNPWLSEGQGAEGRDLRWRVGANPYRKDKVSASPPSTLRMDPSKVALMRSPTVTFLGHSTVWLRLAGRNILTDPVLGNIFPFLSRLQPVPCDPERLPAMDMVLISHAHRDHLDISSLRQLRGNPLIAVPLGCGGILKRWLRNSRLVEFDWFESLDLGDLCLTALPAQHWSKRGLRDTNRTLWASWLVTAPEGRVFFAGDTGYFPGIAEFGRKFGPIDLACLPIGAFEPRWFMRSVHMGPEEAVLAANDLRARRVLPIHWGTFGLGDEPVDLPPRAFQKAWAAAKAAPEETRILQPGANWAFLNTP